MQMRAAARGLRVREAPVRCRRCAGVVSSLSPEGAEPSDSTLYLVASGSKGVSIAGPWDGLGMRADASAPMAFEDCEVAPAGQLTQDGAGFPTMINVVLPLFNLGTASVALGLCGAAVAGTASHLKTARFEHLGESLGEGLPTLRALLAGMQIETDGLAARIDDLIDNLERPCDTTVLRVLEAKAAAGDAAISVTSAAMRASAYSLWPGSRERSESHSRFGTYPLAASRVRGDGR